MKKKSFLIGILISTIALMILACLGPQEPLPVLRIGHAPHDHHSPLYVAAMNPKYFKKNGGIYLKEKIFHKEYTLISNNKPIAQVQVETSTGGSELIRRLAEGHFDISFGGVPAILSLIDKGRQIQILAPVMAEGAGLIVHIDMPMNNWDDFLNHVRHHKRPIRIGYKTLVSVQNLIFEHALQESGISFSMKMEDTTAQVVMINLHGANMLIPALKNGLIDGFVIMQPFLALAETTGVGKTIALLRDMPPDNKWHGHPCCALAANNTFVQSRPEISEALLTLMLRARKFIIDHPKKSAQQVSKWLETPIVVEEHSLPTIDFSVELNNSWNEGINFWLESMIESGRLKGKLRDAHRDGDLEDLIYNQALYNKAIRNLQ
ncbi:MAG: ABC transporter substrate-binding protein [Desulfobulbaceae bacterium]|nr:ABC transporter substrate-binding protein [Desulfobulbaceae bacterium]